MNPILIDCEGSGKADCDGICLAVAEVVWPLDAQSAMHANEVAYAHPGCPLHDSEPMIERGDFND